MGCDGGTIPKRDELVRKKKKPEQKDKDSELSFRWQHCSITQEPLDSPIVACGLGRLYNKDAVIEALLERSKFTEGTEHIRNLKDVKELKLTPNPAFKPSAEKGDAYIDRQAAPYICPITGLEMNGKFRFIFLWKCGCVMSERALKAVKTQSCHKCQEPFINDDVIVLNGSPEDVSFLESNLQTRQARLKAEKKATSLIKRKNGKESSAEASVVEPPQKLYKLTVNSSNSCNSPMLAHNGNGTNSKSSKAVSKLNGIKMGNTITKGTSTAIQDPLFKKTKESYSVAKDPRASEVYKSLFTSHQKAHEQTKAHWVTYNPFYN